MPKTQTQQRDGVFTRADRKGFFVSYIDASGIRRKQKIVAHTRAQAVTVLQAIKTRVQQEKILGVKHISEITVSDLFERFRRHQKARVRPATYERLDAICDALQAMLPDKARDISRETISQLISTRLETVAPATIAKEVAILKHALRMACEWDLLRENPAIKIDLPKIPEGRIRYLSPSELHAILAAAPEWMRAPIALAAFTGMRRGEILKLRWMDIDLANCRVYLRETKNGALRVLPLNSLAVRVFESVPLGGPADAVFPGVDPARLTVATKRLFAKFKIHDASFHSLRHTAASWLTMQGVDLYTVGKILGHKTPRMTQRYAHLSPQYLAGAAGRLEGVFGSVLQSEPVSNGSGLVPTESPAQNAMIATEN